MQILRMQIRAKCIIAEHIHPGSNLSIQNVQIHLVDYRYCITILYICLFVCLFDLFSETAALDGWMEWWLRLRFVAIRSN